MAGVLFWADTGEVSLSAATAKTCLEIGAAANHRVLIHQLSVMFKGTTAGNEPATVELTRFAASGTGTAVTEVKFDETDDETIQTACEHTATVEPAAQTVLQTWSVHPSSGVIWTAPITNPIPIKGGGFAGIRITADDAVTVTVNALLEE